MNLRKWFGFKSDKKKPLDDREHQRELRDVERRLRILALELEIIRRGR